MRPVTFIWRVYHGALLISSVKIAVFCFFSLIRTLPLWNMKLVSNEFDIWFFFIKTPWRSNSFLQVSSKIRKRYETQFPLNRSKKKIAFWGMFIRSYVCGLSLLSAYIAPIPFYSFPLNNNNYVGLVCVYVTCAGIIFSIFKSISCSDAYCVGQNTFQEIFFVFKFT